MADGGREEIDDSTGKNSGGKFDRDKYREELEPQFKELYKKDKYLPATLAYRSALRVFPLIAERGHFDFWNTKEDLRAFYALSLYEMLLLTSKACLSQTDNDLKRLREFGNAASAAADYITAADAVAYVSVYADAVVSVSVYAAAFAAAVAAASAVYAATAPDVSAATAPTAPDVSAATAPTAADVDVSAATAADATASYVAFIKVIEVNQQEINFANTHSLEELIEQPIWPSGVPDDVIAVYNSKFKPAVIALADEQADKSVADALLKMLADYEVLLQLGDVDENLTQIISPETAAENEAAISDALNREGLVKALYEKLKHHSNKGHLTVGLLGHWGSGKTRILNLLKDRVFYKNKKNANEEKNTEFIWGEFNAWAYEHTENIQAGMAHEIIQALTRYRIPFKENKTSYRFVEYLRYKGYRLWRWLVWSASSRLWLAAEFAAHRYPVKSLLFGVVLLISSFIAEFIFANWGDISQINASSYAEFSKSIAKLGLGNIAALGSVPFLLVWFYKQVKQLFSQPYTKELLTYIKLPSYAKHLGLVSEMRDDIALMCKLRLQRTFLGLGKQKRLIFVVDDLDRCSPDGIVKTLEAVRLILDIENVTVILAIDQRIALAALAYHYQEIQEFHTSGDARTIARDYLGKIIHLPINIPEPDIETVKGYMGYVWQNDEGDSEELDWRQLVLPEDKAKMEQGDNSDERPKQPSEEQQDSDSGKDTGSEKDSNKKLTVEEVAQLILEEPLPEAVKPKPESILKGLTPEQKAAFVYWTDQFQLTNPRQLKRLHNSYNLLQLVSEKIDKIVSDKYHLAFGYLVTLIALEFINNQLDLRLASELKDYLFSGKTDDEDTPIGETPESLKPLNDDNLIGTCRNAREVICTAADVLVSYDSNHSKLSALFSLVNAFVLPAIEVVNAKSVKFENSEVKT
ncbi:KAP family P-loop NTPase fold protein [Sessilibacter corallicola]|uniref:KAP family P-loop NTPase fold protein n=1 Tax=Sessilibacter corallicola TaxID=2904075 RepID=UPI001E3B60A3|nr:P-loop NTPase fold protein [Sessilibacter corallicola]MCE2027182.1 KAP family NTPase [Sessilibacter corallicola]